jgi:hypothetical protein
MKKRFIFAVLALIAGLMVFTACGDGPNTSVWSMVVNNNETTFDGGFSITVQSARSGTRNITRELNTDEIRSIAVNSSSNSGEIVLTISQDGNLDGSEVVIDISNFNGDIDTSSLNPGRIRFSLRFDEIRGSDTTIRWR